MMFGGLLAAADRRFRRLPEPAPTPADANATSATSIAGATA
jgi:hypothetical protein